MGRRLLPSEFGTGTIPTGEVLTASPDTLQIVGTPNTANDSVNKQYVDDQIAANTGSSDYQSKVIDVIANPATNYPGNGDLSSYTPTTGDRFIVESSVTANNANWGGNNDAFSAGDLIEYNGTKWVVAFAIAGEEGTLVWNQAENLSASRSEGFYYYDTAWQRAYYVESSTAGDALSHTNGVLNVNVDDVGIEINADSLRLKDLGVTTAKINDDAVTAAKLAADTAGSGLSQGAGGELDINVDDVTVEVSGDTLQVKAGGIGTTELADDGVTAAKLAADTAGDGLVQNGTTGALDVNVDDVTIETNADVVQVKDSGISAAKLATDSVTGIKIAAAVAGAGLSKDGGNNLQVNVAGGVEISGDNVQLAQTYTFGGSAAWSFPTGATLSVADDPTSGTHVANKNYVDSVVSGTTDWKNSARLASNADSAWTTSVTADFTTSGSILTISGLVAGSSRGQLDGVEAADGDRILLKDMGAISAQSIDTVADTASNLYNGLWEVTGGTTTSLTMTRTGDADEDVEVTAGLAVFVEEGTNNSNNGYLVTSPDPLTVGTDPIVFTQFSGAGQVLAGDGLDKSGNTLSVDVTDIIDTAAGLTETGNDIQVNLTTANVDHLDFDPGTGGIRISTAAAGDGLVGGGNAALSVNVDGSTIEISGDALQVMANGITGNEIAADAVDDTHLDLGNGANQINASTFGFSSSGYDGQATNIEGALNELLIVTETFDITTTEETNRYFDLSFTPAKASSVRSFIPGGAEQLNAAAGASAKDYQLGNVNLSRVYIRNGAGVGGDGTISSLSELIADGDELVFQYQANA